MRPATRWLAAWRLPLRLAWREARRAPLRSALVLVMIALPVLAVTVADTVYSTYRLDGAQGIERRLGAAQARVQLGPSSPVAQLPDPDRGAFQTGGDGTEGPATLEQVRRVLGPRPAVEVREGSVGFVTDAGVGEAGVLLTDLTDPLAEGLVELTAGRWPGASDEVMVNAALLERGPGLGDDLAFDDGSPVRVVGTAETATTSSRPMVFGPPGSVPLDDDGRRAYLLGGAPVSWAQVGELNTDGVTVLSRAVLADPPPTSVLDPEIRFLLDGVDEAALTVLVLVVVMVLIEVVLLAGPAFAVGARRQARTLALMAAAGGSPRDARRVVLGSGVVLGLLGSLLGLGLGLVAARVLLPAFQGFADARFGPFDVNAGHLLGVGGFGLLSALLAAAVPAFTAARQDVVAVLGGRRGDTRASRRSPVLGLALLGGGIAGAAYGAGGAPRGELFIAGSAIVSVLGMVLVVPVVVVAVAALARRLPLSLRFAARDAARHRTRTVPAVAAVAATVAGVVALGIATSSDEAQNVASYVPQAPQGIGYVTHDAWGAPDLSADREVLSRELPRATVVDVVGVPLDTATGGSQSVEVPSARAVPLLTGWAPGPGGDVLVAASSLPPTLQRLAASPAQITHAERTLAEGGAVVLSDTGVELDEVRLVARTQSSDARRPTRTRATVPAAVLPVATGEANAQLVLSPEAAAALGVESATTALTVSGDFTAGEERDAREALAALPGEPTFYVEHGYQRPDAVVIVYLVLGGLGAVLMLGGTLTATFLALSDARPDLATLAAVGASPRTRRGVAASYALVVGLVGALLGALVGLVPGVAITYPLTRPGPFGELTGAPSHYLDIPWLLVLGVVVGLPLLTAALVGLTARSRLPLVARLD